MAHKISLQMRLRLYPQSAIPQRTSDPHGACDLVRDLILRDRGEGAGDVDLSDVSAITGETGVWGNQKFTGGPLLQHVKFTGGTVETGAAAALGALGLSGFTLRGRVVYKNCRVRGDEGDVPSGDGSFGVLWFKVLKGETHLGKSLWKTALPAAPPLRTRLYHTRQTPNHDVKIRTETPLEPNRSFIVDLTQLQIAQRQIQKARLRIEWGGTFSIVLRQGANATLERRHTPGGAWDVWKEFTASGAELLSDEKSGALRLAITQQGGRLVVAISGGRNETQTYDILDSVRVLNSPRDEPTSREVDIFWSAAPLIFTMYGVQAHIGLALIDFRNADGTPQQDFFVRVVPRSGKTPPATTENATEGSGRAFGWIRRGTSADIETNANADAFVYICTLTASPDGISAPFVTGAMAALDGDWQQLQGAPFHVTGALSRPVQENGAQLGITADSELHFDLSRTRLDSLPLPDDAPEGATWEHYLIEDGYNPCDFAVRWMLSDGTFTAWTGRFKGYVYQQTRGTEQWNSHTLSVVARGPLLRYTAPAACIDSSYPPLINLFPDHGLLPIFAADAIKEIIRLTLGGEESEKLNGNGDARRFLPVGKAPLISPETDRIGLYSGADGKPPTTDQVLFKPPWYKDALTWIKQLQNDDSGGQGTTLFTYGFINEAGTVSQNGAPENGGTPDGEAWPVPLYGDIGLILGARPTWTLADARIEGVEDYEAWISHIEVQTRPDQDFNHWIVANHSGEKDGFSLISPALRMSEARLPPTDPRSEEKSWRRTEVVELTNAQLEEDTLASIANGLVRDNENLSPRHPHLTFRGVEGMQQGDLVKPKMLQVLAGNTRGGAGQLHLNNNWFRIIKLDNEYDPATGDMSGGAIVFPLTEAEKSALGLE